MKVLGKQSKPKKVMKKAMMVTCKVCGKVHNLNETKRSLGKESMVVLLKMCSAQCYTSYLQKPKEAKTNIEFAI